MPPVKHLANPNLTWYEYNPEEAKELLTESGWEDTNEDGIRDRNGEELKVTFVASATFSPRTFRNHRDCTSTVERSWNRCGIADS